MQKKLVSIKEELANVPSDGKKVRSPHHKYRCTMSSPVQRLTHQFHYFITIKTFQVSSKFVGEKGGRGKFFRRIWCRLHQLPLDEDEAAQSAKKKKMKKS